MRNTIAWLLLVALLLCPTLNSALAAQGDVVLFERAEDGTQSEWIQGACAVGDTLYLKGGNGFYTWKMGDAEPSKLFEYKYDADADSSVPMDWYGLRGPVVVDGKPLLLSSQTGVFMEFADGKFTETEYKVDMGSMPDYTGDPLEIGNLIDYMLMAGDQLILCARASDMDWNSNRLFAADLKTGKITTLTDKISRITSVAPYKSGKLLVAIDGSYSMSGGMSEDDYYVSLRILDIQSAQFEGDKYLPLREYNLNFFAYDPDADAIYFVQNNRVLKTAWGGVPDPVNFLSRNSYGSDCAAFMLDGRLVVPSSDGVSICSVDPAKMPTQVLKVAGDWSGDDALPMFIKAYPEVAVNRTEQGLYNIENVTTAIAGGEAPDVFCFYSSNGLDALIQKGYAMDLSGDAKLMELAAQLYPQIQDVIFRDGKLYGYPGYFDAGLWAYDAAAFEEFDLGAFPETMADFIDLIVLWDDDYADRHPDRQLLDFGTDIKQQLFYQIFSRYITMAIQPDQPLSFNTPEFRQSMEKLERSPLRYLTEAEQQQANDANMSRTEYRERLIDEYSQGLGNYYEHPKTLVLPPRLTESAEPFAPGSMQVYIINPNTKYPEAALNYVRFMAEHMRAEYRYLVNPSLNEPIEDPWYAESKKSAQENYDRLLKEEIDPADQRQHDAELEEARRYLEVEIERWRWNIAPDTLARYRELAPSIKLFTGTSLFDGEGGQELYKIIERHQQGQLDLEQMIRELDQKAQMIFLETR